MIDKFAADKLVTDRSGFDSHVVDPLAIDEVEVGNRAAVDTVEAIDRTVAVENRFAFAMEPLRPDGLHKFDMVAAVGCLVLDTID